MRVIVALTLSTCAGLLLGRDWALLRTIAVGLLCTLVFTIFERRPRRLPRWISRWALQVIAVGVAVPLSTLALWIVSTKPGAAPFWETPDRFEGWMMVTFFGLLVAPWTALAAVVRQKEAFAREQELAALEARLHLLQAQVAPHFLFNTLANVQALVDAGSPHASALLRSLIAYLRAAVPLLNEPAATLGRELTLVKAYLELMHMRMPDRLTFTMNVDESAPALRCPPTTLLTLVENAVRHGIDPSEEGGAITIDVEQRGERCLIRVRDTGVGLHHTSAGLGTGLVALRERLQLVFGGDARLTVTEQEPQGVCAELDMPARAGAA